MMCFPPPLYQHKARKSFIQGGVVEKILPNPAYRLASSLQKHQAVATLQSSSWGNCCGSKAPLIKGLL